MSDIYSGFDNKAVESSDDIYAGFAPAPKVLPRAIGSVGSNGQQAGESLRLAKKSGIAGPVIDADLPGFKQQYNAQQANQIVNSNSVIQRYLEADSLHVKISNDDYEHLDKVVGIAKEANSDSLISRLFKATQQATAAGYGDESQPHKELRQDYPALYEALSKFTLGLPDIAEVAAKLPGAVFGGIAGFGTQVARESGMSEAWAARLERDLGIIGTGVLVESGIGAKGSTKAPKVKGAKPEPTVRPESTEMLKRDTIPPPGFDPIIDEVYTQQAKLDSINLDKLIEARNESITHGRSIDAFESFTSIATSETQVERAKPVIAELQRLETEAVKFSRELQITIDNYGKESPQVEKILEQASEVDRLHKATNEKLKKIQNEKNIEKTIGISVDAIADLYASEKKSPSPDDGLLGWIPDLEQKVRDAQVTGGDVEVSLGGYVARIDASVHTKLQDFLRLRRDGVSIAESKELPKKIVPKELVQVSSDPVEAALQTIAQIQQESLHLTPVFADAKAAGMADSEFARYNKKIEDRQTAIDERAISAASREIKRRQSTEWKSNEATIREEVQTDTKYNPTLIADEYFRTGKSPNDFVPAGIKISDQYKRAGLAKEMFTKDGAHPDDIAPLFGFNSGEALLNRLELLESARKGNKETPAEHLKRIVGEETDRRMETKYGNLDENIRKEAEEAVMGQQQLDILADELRALAKQSGEEFQLTRDELTRMIKDKFDTTPVETLTDSKKLQREVSRAGQQVERALLGKANAPGGNILEALKWAQRRLLSFGLAREALRFEREKARIEKNIDSLLNDKEISSVEQEHVEQARAMLQSIGYTGSQPIRSNLTSRAQFVADSNGQISIAPWLIDSNSRVFKGPEDISVKDFRDLGKSLQSIMHAGREATKLENIHGKADLQNVVFDIKKSLDRFDLIEQPLNPSIPQRVKGLARWLNAWSLLPERMLDYTDKFDPRGPITSYLDRPLRDANVKEIKLTEDTTRKLRALQKYTDNSIMDIIPNDVIPSGLARSGFLDLNRRNLRQLMGHMGSESGIKKITEGFGVKEADVWKLIHDNATEADWKWVSGMHEIFKDLWEESSKMQERDTGVAADPIDPVKMVSPKHGEFPGGYWPIKYDRKRSNIEGHIASKNPLFDEHYVQAATPQAYTLTRTEFAAPLDLSGQLIGSHIQGMVHDIAFREAVRNAGKLINNGEFMAAMTQKWSAEYAGLLHGWLKDIANSHNVDDSYAQGAARWSSIIRQNVVSTLIALNPGTFIKHGATAAAMSTEKVGLSNISSAAIDVGVRGIVGAAKDLIKSPRTARPEPEFVDALKMVTDPSPRGDEVRQFILDSSAVMRNRQRNYQDTIRGAYESSIYSGPLQTAADARQMSMTIGRFPVALSDAVSAMPTWYAAYKTAFERTGDHVDAVFEADRQVARAHGSSAIMDKARIMRTGEAMRWVTPLYNFWNHMQNNYMQMAWDMGAIAKGRDEPNANIKSLSNRMFWLVVLPVAIEEMASPALDEDRRSLGQRVFLATLRHFGSGYIGIRDITNAAANGYEPSVGLLGTVTKSMANAARDVIRVGSGQVVSKDWMTHAATALGFAIGLGGTQLGKSLSFEKDLLTGTEKPKTFNEYRQGFRTGHSKARIHK